jgi:type IV secretion system protein VirB9
MIRASTALATAMVALAPTVASAQHIPAIQQSAQYPGSMPTDGSAATGQSGAGIPGEQAVAEVPRAMPPNVPVLSPDKPLDIKQKAAVKAASRWRKKSAIPTIGEDGSVRFVYGAGEPTIVCAPLHICDLALDPGEVVTRQPHVGDKRFQISYEVAGTGRNATTHIIIKPNDAGLESNLLIHTNRDRVYSIKLTSHSKDYMPLVAFTYPNQESDKSWQNYSATVAKSDTEAQSASSSPCDQSPSVPPSAFGISGDGVGWKPVQVYAVSTPVGQKTCVQFPADIGSRRLPALLALGKDGGWFSGPTLQMVDAHFANNRYVVDELLDRFALVAGVGSNQERITVERVK